MAALKEVGADLVFNLYAAAATGSKLRINDFKAQGSNPQGVDVEVAGDGLIEDFFALQPFSHLGLVIKVVSPDCLSLKGYLPDDLPELGPARGSLRLVGVSPEALGVEDIALDFGSDNGLSLRAEGRIAMIPLVPGTIKGDLQNPTIRAIPVKKSRCSLRRHPAGTPVLLFSRPSV